MSMTEQEIKTILDQTIGFVEKKEAAYLDLLTKELTPDLEKYITKSSIYLYELVQKVDFNTHPTMVQRIIAQDSVAASNSKIFVQKYEKYFKNKIEITNSFKRRTELYKADLEGSKPQIDDEDDIYLMLELFGKYPKCTTYKWPDFTKWTEDMHKYAKQINPEYFTTKRLTGLIPVTDEEEKIEVNLHERKSGVSGYMDPSFYGTPLLNNYSKGDPITEELREEVRTFSRRDPRWTAFMLDHHKHRDVIMYKMSDCLTLEWQQAVSDFKDWKAHPEWHNSNMSDICLLRQLYGKAMRELCLSEAVREDKVLYTKLRQEMYDIAHHSTIEGYEYLMGFGICNDPGADFTTGRISNFGLLQRVNKYTAPTTMQWLMDADPSIASLNDHYNLVLVEFFKDKVNIPRAYTLTREVVRECMAGTWKGEDEEEIDIALSLFGSNYGTKAYCPVSKWPTERFTKEHWQKAVAINPKFNELLIPKIDNVEESIIKIEQDVKYLEVLSEEMKQNQELWISLCKKDLCKYFPLIPDIYKTDEILSAVFWKSTQMFFNLAPRIPEWIDQYYNLNPTDINFSRWQAKKISLRSKK